ncbi:MAG: YDG domain-containing protein, partial [Actinomycetes bacterium]
MSRTRGLLTGHRMATLAVTLAVVIAVMALVPGTAMAAVAFRASANGSGTNTNLTINKPAGTVAGDVMIVNIAKVGNRTTNPSLAGWTLLRGADLLGTTLRYGAVLYRLATADDASTTNYTFALGTGTNASSGVISTFSGVDASTASSAIDAYSASITVSDANTCAAPAISTGSANAMVIMFGMAANGTPAWSGFNTTSPGLLNTGSYSHAGTNSSVGAGWKIKTGTGTTGPVGAAALSVTERNGGMLVSLKPATTTNVAVTAISVDDKVYDGSSSVATSSVHFTTTPALSGGVTVTCDAASYADKNVGPGKTLTVTGIHLSDTTNYTLTSGTTGTTTGKITAKGITGSFTASNKVYDGNANASVLTSSLAGVVSGDVVRPTGGTVTFSDKNVGAPKTVTWASATLAGADFGNYSLTSMSTTTANIIAKGLTITPDDQTKTYGDTLTFLGT